MDILLKMGRASGFVGLEASAVSRDGGWCRDLSFYGDARTVLSASLGWLVA